jgi:hypothetical protein
VVTAKKLGQKAVPFLLTPFSIDFHCYIASSHLANFHRIMMIELTLYESPSLWPRPQALSPLLDSLFLHSRLRRLQDRLLVAVMFSLWKLCLGLAPVDCVDLSAPVLFSVHLFEHFSPSAASQPSFRSGSENSGGRLGRRTGP